MWRLFPDPFLAFLENITLPLVIPYRRSYICILFVMSMY